MDKVYPFSLMLNVPAGRPAGFTVFSKSEFNAHIPIVGTKENR